MNRRIYLLPAAVSLAVNISCAARLATLPAGPGRAFSEYAGAYDEATQACRDIKTMAAVLSISGRAAGSRLPRAKIDAGFEAPARVRLELPAPGKPFFVFVATGDEATLVFPREGRVLQKAPAAATLEALTGVALDPDELRAIVGGCGFSSAAATTGRAYDGGWTAVDVEGSTAWLQSLNNVWRLVAATRGPLDVRYADFAAGRPSTVRVRTSPTQGARPTDLTLRLSQVDLNTPLGPDAFTVDIPSNATPMTLQELREAGPLGR